ncbi:M23 family metallopeptidase [candidate division WOR-3 bacterium]|nr:M23 family metallopeptidase [candidate division WOR-3 bacterium]MCK4526557.1 M23 family metallopeptidase [candidate division WOR-3 bacterium]
MKRYTIQIIPSEGDVKQITIKHRTLVLIGILGGVIIGAFIYFGVNFTKMYVRNVQYNLMKREVSRLKKKEMEIKYLSREIRKFYALSNKLNEALGMNIPRKITSQGSNDHPLLKEGMNSFGETMEEEARRLREFIPDIMPCQGGWISNGYSEDHKAIDISLKEGTAIFSTMEGEVIFSGELQYLGKIIKIHNNEGFLCVYAHNSKNLVRKGDMVKKGNVIALSGNTGRSEAPHLHYGIMMQGKWVNPINYLPVRRNYE